jgi:hypothetical protein
MLSAPTWRCRWAAAAGAPDGAPRNEGLDALVDFGRAMSRELGLLLDSVVKRGRPTRARLDTGG